jgi:hypothetical protein
MNFTSNNNPIFIKRTNNRIKEGSSNIGIGVLLFWSSPIGNSNTVLGIYAFTSSSGSNNNTIGSNAIRQGVVVLVDNNALLGCCFKFKWSKLQIP